MPEGELLFCVAFKYISFPVFLGAVTCHLFLSGEEKSQPDMSLELLVTHRFSVMTGIHTNE